MFEELDGNQVLLRDAQGCFREATMCSLHGELFAKLGSRYVRLKTNGSTSHPKIHFTHIETNLTLYENSIGWLYVEQRPNTKLVELVIDSSGNQKTLPTK